MKKRSTEHGGVHGDRTNRTVHQTSSATSSQRRSRTGASIAGIITAGRQGYPAAGLRKPLEPEPVQPAEGARRSSTRSCHRIPMIDFSNASLPEFPQGRTTSVPSAQAPGSGLRSRRVARADARGDARAAESATGASCYDTTGPQGHDVRARACRSCARVDRRAPAHRRTTSRSCTTPAAARSRRRWSSSPRARACPPSSCARGRARPRHHPRQHQPPRARADDHRPQLPGEDQRQHRQLRGRARRSRRRSRSCAGRPAGAPTR